MRYRCSRSTLTSAVLLCGVLIAAGCGQYSATDPNAPQDTGILAKGPGSTTTLTIRSFSPTSGNPGDAIRVDGSGFDIATKVQFSGPNGTFIPADSTLLLSTSRVVAIVPTGAVTGPIRVTTGTNATVTSTGTFTSLTPAIAASFFDITTLPELDPAAVAAGTASNLANASTGDLVQLRPARARFEVQTDVPQNFTAFCQTLPLDPAFFSAFPSLNSLQAKLEADDFVLDPVTGAPIGLTPVAGRRYHLSGKAQVVLDDATLDSVIPEPAGGSVAANGGTIAVTDISVVLGEPGVALANDADGNLIEFVWLGGAASFVQPAPIVRIELVDPTLVNQAKLLNKNLRLIWDLKLVDTVGTDNHEWRGTVGNVIIP